MFPVSPEIVVLNLVLVLAAGFTVGIITGFLLTWIRKRSRRGLWKAGLLGMLAFVTVFVGMIYISATTNTEDIYTNPALVALFAAIAAPALRELLRNPDKTV